MDSAKQDIKSLTNQLSNPSIDNKAHILQEIQRLTTILINHNQIPYFCSHCNYSHKPGKKYELHKQFAEFKFRFPDVSPPIVFRKFQIRMVGIFYAESGKYLKSMKPYTNLILEHQKIRFRDRISVSFMDTRKKTKVHLGFLYEKVKKFRWVVRAKQHKEQDLRATFLKYYPSNTRLYFDENEVHEENENNVGDTDEQRKVKYSFRDPPKADILIEIQDNLQVGQLFKDLMDLLELGHPNLTNAFLRMGPSIRQLLEEEARSKSGDILAKIQKIISEFDRRHKIPLSNNYTLLL